MFWKSVVAKLWITIVLLFVLVLFILMMMLLQFFHNFYLADVEKRIKDTNQHLFDVLASHEINHESIQVAFEANVGDTESIIIFEDKTVLCSIPNVNSVKAYENFIKDEKLSKPLIEKISISETMYLPKIVHGDDENQSIIIGVPFDYNGVRGAVYSFQSLDLTTTTTKTTMKYILITVGIAIVLMTIFAFYLLTRITYPLRTMKMMANEISNGQFDNEIPILTSDEVGDLAVSFNQMAQQTKHSITALSQEKEHLSSILSSMAGGVVTFNRDGDVILTNPPADTFIRYCLYERDKFFSENQNQVPNILADLFEKVKVSKQSESSEVSVQGHDWVITMSPLYHNQNIRGAVAVLREVTEEKRLSKLRNDFITNVSHELRTPIAMLQGYSEAIIDDVAESQEEKKEIAQIIYEESFRMGRLVNELLDLARIEAGHIILEVREIEIIPYLQRISNKFQGLAKEKNVKISMKTDQEIKIQLDPDRIEQVLTNLIDNAIRHSSKNGTVEIIQETLANGMYIHIKDSGTGIAEEDLSYVFERFYKGDKARTRGRSGTGLGLAIAKNIIEAHQGIIGVTSKLNRGTTFSFFLPRIQE